MIDTGIVIATQGVGQIVESDKKSGSQNWKSFQGGSHGFVNTLRRNAVNQSDHDSDDAEHIDDLCCHTDFVALCRSSFRPSRSHTPVKFML